MITDTERDDDIEPDASVADDNNFGDRFQKL